MMGWLELVCFVLMRVRTDSKRDGRSFAHVLDSEIGATLVGLQCSCPRDTSVTFAAPASSALHVQALNSF
jgi:hypothetical protein